MQIRFIKKVKADSSTCCKSVEIIENLEKLGLLNHIKQIIIVDECGLSSEGWTLALKYKVEAAPFFLIEKEDGSITVFTAYFRFLKEVFNQPISESEEITEILVLSQDLSFI
jgi:hypothetical protein